MTGSTEHPHGSGPGAGNRNRKPRPPATGLLRRWWERRKRKVFPTGAITWHLGVWSTWSLDEAQLRGARELCDRFGLSELLVVHGSVWSCGDQLTLVGGPAGIGKSTVLRELERRGRGRLVEDGVVLVGQQGDRWTVVETGTLELLDLTSRIAKVIRRVTRTNTSFWQHQDPAEAQRSTPVRARFLRRLPALSFSLAVAVARPARRPFTPVCRRLTRLVEAEHSRDAYPSLRILGNGSVRQLTSLAESAPPGVSTTAVSPLGGIVEVRRRLREALLTAPAGGTS